MYQLHPKLSRFEKKTSPLINKPWTFRKLFLLTIKNESLRTNIWKQVEWKMAVTPVCTHYLRNPPRVLHDSPFHEQNQKKKKNATNQRKIFFSKSSPRRKLTIYIYRYFSWSSRTIQPKLGQQMFRVNQKSVQTKNDPIVFHFCSQLTKLFPGKSVFNH